MESRPGRDVAGRDVAGRYIAGLCASALGLCGGGWLVLTPFAFGYPGRGREAMSALATGGGLIVVATLTLVCWALAWRRRLRADGVLPPRQPASVQRKTRRSARRQARAERLVRTSRQRELEPAPDPAQVLTDLRALLTPLLSAAEESVAVMPPQEPVPAQAPLPVPEPAQAPLPVPEPAQAPLPVPEPAQAPLPVPEPAGEASREVQAPGHLRGTRSASFFALPRQAGPGSLTQGAELLMVGTGEEESW